MLGIFEGKNDGKMDGSKLGWFDIIWVGLAEEVGEFVGD